MRQSIKHVDIEIESDAFWNWLADESGHDLHDLQLTEAFDQGTMMRFRLAEKPPPSVSEAFNVALGSST